MLFYPFSVSTTAYVLSMTSAIISSLGSSIILRVIWKSSTKLNTTYHRIMAAMSIFDIFASAAMAFSVFPSPSDNIFRLNRPMWGNHTTCRIQGFFIIMGFAGGGFLYMCLAWYMVCKIKFKMNTERMRRWIEPLMLSLALVGGLFSPCFLLGRDLINPTPFDPFCNVAPYPDRCDISITLSWYDCEFSEGRIQEYMESLVVASIVPIVNSVVIVIAMCIIISTVYGNAKKIKAAIATRDAVDSVRSNLESEHVSVSYGADSSEDDVNDLEHSQVLVIQALMYIFAYFITWIFMLICIITSLNGQTCQGFIEVAKTIFLPLQGFWNMIIFAYDKAYLLRKTAPSYHRCHAFILVLIFPEDAPEAYLTNLAMVETLNKSISKPSYLLDQSDGFHLHQGSQNHELNGGIDPEVSKSISSREGENEVSIIRRRSNIEISPNGKRRTILRRVSVAIDDGQKSKSMQPSDGISAESPLGILSTDSIFSVIRSSDSKQELSSMGSVGFMDDSVNSKQNN